MRQCADGSRARYIMKNLNGIKAVEGYRSPRRSRDALGVRQPSQQSGALAVFESHDFARGMLRVTMIRLVSCCHVIACGVENESFSNYFTESGFEIVPCVWIGNNVRG